MVKQEAVKKGGSLKAWLGKKPNWTKNKVPNWVLVLLYCLFCTAVAVVIFFLAIMVI
jgi:hypothetical protein